jgi:anti-sigma factor RsiW
MKCSKAHKLISLHIDGELPEEDIETLEEHMKACHKCRKEFEEGKALHNVFASVDRFKAPYGFHAKVIANVNASKTVRIFRVPIPVRLAEAVMVLVVIAAGIMSGTLLIKGIMPEQAGDVAVSLHLDVFDSAPPDSLSGAYFAMTEVRDEK